MRDLSSLYEEYHLILHYYWKFHLLHSTLKENQADKNECEQSKPKPIKQSD